MTLNCIHFKIFEPTLQTLGSSLPQLKKLDIKSRSSLNQLNSVIENFPNLETLKFVQHTNEVDVAFVWREGLINDNLKHLRIEIKKTADCKDIFKIFKGLKKLQSFYVVGVSASKLQTDFTQDMIERLEIDGQHLIKFSWIFAKSSEFFFDESHRDAIKLRLQGRFSTINYNAKHWIMDKSMLSAPEQHIVQYGLDPALLAKYLRNFGRNQL